MDKQLLVSLDEFPDFVLERPSPGSWDVALSAPDPGCTGPATDPVVCIRRWLHQAAAFGRRSRGRRRRSLDVMHQLLAENPYLPPEELRSMARELAGQWTSRGRPVRLGMLQVFWCWRSDPPDGLCSRHRAAVDQLAGLLEDHLRTFEAMDRCLEHCERPEDMLRSLAGVLDEEEIIFFRLGNLLSAIENEPDPVL